MLSLSSPEPAPTIAAPSRNAPWYLFSPRVDLAVFLGSAVLSLVALLVGWKLGLLDRDTPEWTWIATVLLVDVAHVYATVFRVYADPDELQRAPVLYTLTPVLGLSLGIGLYWLGGELVFWRVLAYVAVYHFVRQQYGWVMLYRARRGERDRPGRWIDSTAIYAATLYPLLYWHAHLPRRFWWFMPQDFLGGADSLSWLVTVGATLYWLALGVYALRALLRWRGGFTNPGKDVVVLTTAVCWYAGIVALDSDYAFTVTNVLIHGIPYLALVYWYGRDRCETAARPGIYGIFSRGPMLFLAILWLGAFVEEMVWDRGVWHARPGLFGAPWDVDHGVLIVLVPLLALPQLVHYLLDGFVWKRRSGPFMRRLLQ